MSPSAKDQVFISYSHEDTKWREDLEKHLKPYLRAGSIKSWSDKQISPGSPWLTEIKTALTNTKVASCWLPLTSSPLILFTNMNLVRS
jgi:internalin A